jgi:hypothetical protein
MPDPERDDEHVLLTLPRGERGEIRISRSRFKGYTSTKLHLWYPGDDGELRPGRQVVTLRDNELRDVIAVLAKIAGKVGAPSTDRDAQRAARPPQSKPQPSSGPKAVDLDDDERLF